MLVPRPPWRQLPYYHCLRIRCFLSFEHWAEDSSWRTSRHNRYLLPGLALELEDLGATAFGVANGSAKATFGRELVNDALR